MTENTYKNKNYITIKNKENIFLIIQDFRFNYGEIGMEKEIKELKKEKERENKTFSLILDINNLAKSIKNDDYVIIRNIIRDIKPGNKDDAKIDDPKFNIYIKNCLFDSFQNIYFDKTFLNINQLYISDELYSISPNLNKLFVTIKPKILNLKHIKINSKEQLDDFLLFIYNNENCKELTLEDIFIELIIKKENDESYNQLNQYFFYKEGKIFINNLNIKDGKNIEIKTIATTIKNLKLIDCPLFVIKKETFKNLNNYKDITLDIDENSLLNPNLITKFKINKGCADICYDLDSYKLNKGDSKDYIEYLNDIFEIIIDNKDNNNFRKLKFKNYDITKYEYITGENLTFIDENNWVLNDEEKENKQEFEDFDDEINKKINDNLDKLSNIKELIFDNCTNYFIQLILKLIKNNKSLDLLKLKKCGKEHFDLKNILSLNITNLILFDTPLIVDHFPKEKKSHLDGYEGDFGKVDNLTININSLEHYCTENNLNYFKTIEIIVELINHENFNNKLCFEMNALPIIMSFLVAKMSNYKYIPNDFNFESNEKRQNLIENSFSKYISNLKNKAITIKKNTIKFGLDNYYIIYDLYKEKAKDNKNDYGSDILAIDQDYRTFFDISKIKEIKLIDNIFIYFLENKLPSNDPKTTFLNVIATKKIFKIDFKSFTNAIYKNKFNSFLEFYLSYLKFREMSEIESFDQSNMLELIVNTANYIKSFFTTINNYTESFTIILDNIKERKELYCILCFWSEIKIEKNFIERKYKYRGGSVKYMFFDKNFETKKKLNNYFIKELNEEKNDQISSLNYYYTSDEERRLFEKKPNEEINFNDFKFKVEYSFNNNPEFEKLENELIIKFLNE